MPRSPHRPPSLTNRVFLGATSLSSATLSPASLRTTAWRRLHRNAYADAGIAVTHGVRCAAARLVIPETAAIGGRSAAWLYGIELRDTWEPVEVVVPPEDRFGPVRGLKIRTTELTADDVVTEHATRITTPERTAWDIARFLDSPEAVAYLDAMLRARLVMLPALHSRLAASTVPWGRKRVATALRLADHRSESPQESRVRAKLVLAGLPPPVPQHPIYHRGRFVARVDLGWPAQRVAVEYDGVWHADAAQLHRDRLRLNRLVAAGWAVIHVTAVRLHEDFAGVVTDVRDALGGVR